MEFCLEVDCGTYRCGHEADLCRWCVVCRGASEGSHTAHGPEQHVYRKVNRCKHVKGGNVCEKGAGLLST